jgi:outer membrane protein OmpA-like peptidoglycan-associated protein
VRFFLKRVLLFYVDLRILYSAMRLIVKILNATFKMRGGTMKQVLISIMILSLLFSGCATVKEHKKTAIGAGVGAAAGAGVGYAIGGGKGAAIGAAVGALAGGGIGYMMDRQEKEFKAQLAASEAKNAQLQQEAQDAAQRDQQAALAAVQREQDAIILTFKSDVLFDFDSAELKKGAYSEGEIDRVAQIINKYPSTNIKIAGYTDSVGDESYNLKLSEQRAMAVKNALVARGVDASRIETAGAGESNPVADNATEGGRQLNRRVTIVITPRADTPPPSPEG